MKIQSKRNKPQANKIFSDREEPRDSFWKSYRQYKELMQGEGEIKVLTYYGIGGIGKSTLLKKLQEEMHERINDPKYIYFDFNIAQDVRTVLDYLKIKLNNEYGYTFPLYELGVYAYARKIGENMDSPEIKGFIETSPLLNFVVTVAGAIPVVDMFSQLIDAADKGIVYLRTQLNKHTLEINDIENKTPAELYGFLPYLFAQDLANALENNKEPMVIFFDTYERLVNEMSSVGEPLNDDLWIRGTDGLIQNIPNVLWVIAGREKLKWERFDAEWTEALEQHILGNLSHADADNFMKHAGISDVEIRNKLYLLTKGTPVYLDLCVDRYAVLIEQGKKPVMSDFGKNVYALIERFMRYMDDSRKDIVYMLACFITWDDLMVTDLGAKIIPSFSYTAYEKVKDFSFVTKSDRYNYNIHQTVGETIFANCPRAIKSSVIQFVIPYCEEKLKTKGTFDPVYTYHLQWLLRFGLFHYENNDDFIKFYNNYLKYYLKRLAVSGQALLAEHIFEPVMIRANKSGDSLLKALALIESSFWKRKNGEFSLSVSLAEKSAILYETLFGETNEITLKAKHRLGESLRSNGEYKKSYKVLSDVLSERKRLGFSLDEEEIDVRDDIATTMLLLGKYKETLPFVEETLELRKQLPSDERVSSYNTLWNLGVVYSCLGRYQDSLPIQEKLYIKSKELLGERHLGTVSAINKMAHSLYYLGRYEEVVRLDEKVLALRKELLGERHPDTMSAMDSLAVSLDSIERYEEALQLKEKVLAVRKKTLGEKHPDTITSMNNLASSFYFVGRYVDALRLEENVLMLRKEILGEKHPYTISAMNGIAMVLESMGRYGESLQKKEEAFALYKEVLGEKHPDTINVMNGIAMVLESMGRYEESLQKKEEAFALYKEVLGEKHPDTINVMYGIAMVLESMGRYEKAQLLKREVFELRKEVLGEKHPDTIEVMKSLGESSKL